MDIHSRRKFARFFLWSFVLFCCLLPVWQIISPLYTRLLAGIAHPFLPRLATGVDGQKIEFFSRTKGTTVYIVDPRGVTADNVGKAPSISLDARQTHANVPLLLALFFATPGLIRSQYWKQFGIALGALFLWHAGYISFVLYRLAAQVASVDSATVRPVLHLRTDLPYELFLRLFIPQLLPFLLWIGVLHFCTPALAQQGSEETISSIGRNAPCPCGSGRKYKRCCGVSVPVPAQPYCSVHY
jgi:hypothetical protein